MNFPRQAGLAGTGLLTLLLLTANAVHAVAILDFGIGAPTPGSVSFAGGSSPLVGTGIQVDNIAGLSTPMNDGATPTCVGCLLNFTTGGFTGTSGNQWLFAGGGTITIVGGVDLPGSTPDIPAGTVLLNGSWSSADVARQPTGSFRITGGAFVDQQDPVLAAFFGLVGGPTVTWLGNINLSFSAGGSAGSAFVSTLVLSGDVANTSPVPEPSTLLLLGSVLTVIGLWGRKKLLKPATLRSAWS